MTRRTCQEGCCAHHCTVWSAHQPPQKHPLCFIQRDMKAKTRCSCCCRCHDILAPRRWLTWSSKCTNTFPTNALRPSNHHFKRASGSEGRHAAHKRRCPPRATQGCADAEAKKQRNAIALIACALPRSTTKRTAPASAKFQLENVHIVRLVCFVRESTTTANSTVQPRKCRWLASNSPVPA